MRQPRKLIYANNKPKFKILADKYHWILQDETGDSYFPNLCNLLDYLSERLFRKFTKKINDLKDIEQSVTKVYKLNDKVSTILLNDLEGTSK